MDLVAIIRTLLEGEKISYVIHFGKFEYFLHNFVCAFNWIRYMDTRGMFSHIKIKTYDLHLINGLRRLYDLPNQKYYHNFKNIEIVSLPFL